ncbi:MAG: hypothetical protein KGY70_09855 [Bacteroidales bacterium]|nr:hypothetical protein [Bacteroidales bacterium]
MKKYVMILLLFFAGYQVSSFAQAVDDRAVVPVSVTLNSILRLNIESGGNIEFNFNTLQQYQDGISGIGGDDAYSTKISIASSVDWDLRMGAEDAGLITTDSVSVSTSMDLGYITYQVDQSDATVTHAGGEITVPSDDALNGPTQLTQLGTSDEIIQSASGNAGDVAQNSFRIDWACGSTTDGALGNLMGSNLTGGRYSTNVFFILKPAD